MGFRIRISRVKEGRKGTFKSSYGFVFYIFFVLHLQKTLKFKAVFALYAINSTCHGRKRVVKRIDTGYPQNIFLWILVRVLFICF